MNKQLRGAPVNECDERLKVFLFGESGCGKSFFATQFPKAYYIDCEGRIKRQLYIAHLNKNDSAVWQTDNFNDLLEEIKTLASVKHNYQTLVIDSITPIYTKLVDDCHAELLRRSKSGKLAIGQEHREAKKRCKKLVDLLKALDMNVVVLAHAKDKWEDDRVVGTTFDAYDKFDYFSEVVMEARLENEPKNNSYSYKATIVKSTLGTLPARLKIDFNYHTFSKLYEKELKAFTPKPVLDQQELLLQKAAKIHSMSKSLNTDQKVKQETKDHLKFLVAECQISQEIISKWFNKAGISKWEEFTEEQAILIIDKLEVNNPEAKQSWIDFLEIRESYNQDLTEGAIASG
jgi:ABC-type dipeptide/oligopeptide/nickel transport system ATPase component